MDYKNLNGMKLQLQSALSAMTLRTSSSMQRTSDAGARVRKLEVVQIEVEVVIRENEITHRETSLQLAAETRMKVAEHEVLQSIVAATIAIRLSFEACEREQEADVLRGWIAKRDEDAKTAAWTGSNAERNDVKTLVEKRHVSYSHGELL